MIVFAAGQGGVYSQSLDPFEWPGRASGGKSDEDGERCNPTFVLLKSVFYAIQNAWGSNPILPEAHQERESRTKEIFYLDSL